jgi:hypothetical protein
MVKVSKKNDRLSKRLVGYTEQLSQPPGVEPHASEMDRKCPLLKLKEMVQNEERF